MQKRGHARAALAVAEFRDPERLELTIDRSWKILDVSPAVAAWGGSTPEDLRGLDSRGRWVVPPELTEAIAATLSGGRDSAVEVPSILASGRRVEFQISAVAEGARIRFDDVSAAPMAALDDGGSQDLIAERLYIGPAEIALLDRSGRVVSANAAWRRNFANYAVAVPNYGLGADYVDICKAVKTDLDEAALRADLGALFAGRSDNYRKVYRLGAPPDERWRQVTIAPMTIGPATYFVAMHEDLTSFARANAALREAAGQVLVAQEQERARIALEIHDSTSQHLVGLSLGLARMRQFLSEDGAGAQLLEEMAASVSEALEETRTLSYLMVPNPAGDQGLSQRTRRFVEGFGRRAPLAVSFRAEGAVDEANAAEQHAVFRVIQEALSNVYRHARARTVEIALCARQGVLTAVVADDGAGMPPVAGADPFAQISIGVGLHGMRARMEQLGGRLGIDTGPGGTTITASVPMRA